MLIFYFSIGDLVTISTGALVATTVTALIVDGCLGTKITDKIAGTLTFGRTGAFVATKSTAEIGYVIDVSICASSLGDGLAVSIGFSVSSFSSSSVVLSWYF